jgi:hypothetical protein
MYHNYIVVFKYEMNADEANHEVKLIGKRINDMFINFQVFSHPS